MADDVRTFSCTIAHGATQASPTKVSCATPVRYLRRVEMVFPTGLNGNVGVALAAAGQPVIPSGSNQWFVASGETIGFDIAGQVESGAWQLWGYNTGTLDHTVLVRLYLDLPIPAVSALPVPLTGDALVGVVSL